MYSARTDSELRDWLHGASEDGITASFIRAVAEATSLACLPDYALPRPVLLVLKQRYPAPIEVN